MTDNPQGRAPAAPFPGTPETWHAYLTEYSDWFLSNATGVYLDDVPERQVSSRWLGLEPADEQLIAVTEERLGVPLPPSLRAFLLTSDGWDAPVAGWMDRLSACADIDWFRETHQAFAGALDPDDDNDVFLRGLSIAEGEDTFLLDTSQVLPNGEYPAYLLAVKYGSLSEPCASFSELFTLGREELAEVMKQP